MIASTYLIAIGSNRMGRGGRPAEVVAAFLARIDPHWGTPVAASSVHDSSPLGPGRRDYANAVAAIETTLTPPELLDYLKSIERALGRRTGQRWGDRVLDLDIIAWAGGIWTSKHLTIPHREFRKRRFVLAPLCEIAPGWRDPITHLGARHLLARLDRSLPRT